MGKRSGDKTQAGNNCPNRRDSVAKQAHREKGSFSDLAWAWAECSVQPRTPLGVEAEGWSWLVCGLEDLLQKPLGVSSVAFWLCFIGYFKILCSVTGNGNTHFWLGLPEVLGSRKLHTENKQKRKFVRACVCTVYVYMYMFSWNREPL